MKIILLAIRPLMRFRTYTFVNVLGLALSLACVIIISRYVYSELQTDRFYPDLERIYTTIYVQGTSTRSSWSGRKISDRLRMGVRML